MTNQDENELNRQIIKECGKRAEQHYKAYPRFANTIMNKARQQERKRIIEMIAEIIGNNSSALQTILEINRFIDQLKNSEAK